jgi:hypothetical protein
MKKTDFKPGVFLLINQHGITKLVLIRKRIKSKLSVINFEDYPNNDEELRLVNVKSEVKIKGFSWFQIKSKEYGLDRIRILAERADSRVSVLKNEIKDSETEKRIFSENIIRCHNILDRNQK